jgi:cytidine deaminase
MKEVTLSISYRQLSADELSADDRSLIDQAIRATDRSYVPYSHFRVGAAARLADGTVVCGSNQENAAYPSGLCAERTTLFYANSQYPDQAVTTLAIAARNERDEFLASPISPCGACRQVMLETEQRFGRPMRILLYGTQAVYELPSVSALLPFSFGAEAMQ